MRCQQESQETDRNETRQEVQERQQVDDMDKVGIDLSIISRVCAT